MCKRMSQCLQRHNLLLGQLHTRAGDLVRVSARAWVWVKVMVRIGRNGVTGKG